MYFNHHVPACRRSSLMAPELGSSQVGFLYLSAQALRLTACPSSKILVTQGISCRILDPWHSHTRIIDILDDDISGQSTFPSPASISEHRRLRAASSLHVYIDLWDLHVLNIFSSNAPDPGLCLVPVHHTRRQVLRLDSPVQVLSS